MSENARTRGPIVVLIVIASLLEVLFLRLSATRPLEHNVPEAVAVLLAAGAVYLTAVWLVFRFDPRGRATILLIVIAALGFRATLFPMPPSLSNDLHRYAWEGRIQLEGYNPYLYAPSAPEVVHLRPPEYPLLPGRDVPAAYGPAVELIFRVAAGFGGLTSFKLASVAFDLLALLFLLLLLRSRGDPPARSLVYAWCPLVVLEFAGQGHNDSIMVAFLLLGLWLLQQGKPLLASTGLALAFLAKWTGGLLFPLLLRRGGWRAGAIAAGIAIAVTAPFLGSGVNVLEGVGAYARQWRNNAGLFELFRLFSGRDAVALGIAAGVVAGLALFLAWRGGDPVRAAYLLMGTLLLVSPSVFPWYLTWLVPFLAFFPNPALLLWATTVLLSYHVVIGYAALDVWRYDSWLVWLEYAPVLVLLAASWSRPRAVQRRERNSTDMTTPVPSEPSPSIR